VTPAGRSSYPNRPVLFSAFAQLRGHFPQDCHGNLGRRTRPDIQADRAVDAGKFGIGKALRR